MKRKPTGNIVITGAGSALGGALLKEILDSTDDKLITTSRRRLSSAIVKDESRHIHLSGIDLTEIPSLTTLRDKVDAFFDGEFDIIHSVGDFWLHVPFTEYNVESAKNMLLSHYITLYGVCNELIPLMMAKGGGHITAFSCNSVRHCYPHMAAFTSAKSAVETLIRCLANEYAQHGIIANAIALASLQTESVQKSKPFADFEHFMSVEKIAKAVLKINCEDLEYLNGNVINLFRYSESFFNKGYFERNRTKQ